ncbi:MAG: DUF58 domain-containing protein [Nitrososphaerales archaeon]
MPELPVVLLLLLLVAIVLRMDIIFYLVYVLAGAYVLARWWAVRSLKHLQVSRRFTDHIFTGESSTVEISITNRSVLPAPWVRYDESSPVTLSGSSSLMYALALGPKEKVDLHYELIGRQRGLYLVGPGRVAAGDLFGFADLQGIVDEPRRLVVYPRVIPLTAAPLTSRAPHGTLASRQPIFADPARVNGVRPYQPGDPVRTIDWKTSARAGQLEVRKTEPAVSLTTTIFLDLNAAAYSRHLRYVAPEWGIVIAASLANYLIEQRQDVGLGSNGRDELTEATCWAIPPRRGRAHLMKLLEWLARVQLAETRPLVEWLPQATVDLAWGTTVVAVTPSADEATSAALHRLRRAGLNPVLIAIEPHAQFGIVYERCRRLGIAAYEIADETALRRWQARPGRVAAGGLR